MKKAIVSLLALLMILNFAAVFSGCDKNPAPGISEGTPGQNTEEAPENGDSPAPDGEKQEGTAPGEDGEQTTPEETPSAPASFRACSIRTNSLGELKYWLYTPADPTENMPLIVYLHGGSGKGDNLELITAADGFPKYLRDGTLGDVRAYVIIPQLPSSQKGWANGASAVYELIQVTVSKFGINKDNISLTGHSMGGTGTWNLALSYPTLFARIAPLSGSIRNLPEYVEILKNIPVWAFVGSADTIVPPESSMEFVAALKEAGGNAGITIFGEADHFTVPSLTYLDEDIGILNWLLGNAG